MNLNPTKWKFPQWLTVITSIVFIAYRWNTSFVISANDSLADVFGYYVFEKILPRCFSIAIIIAMLISLVYVFGIYYDIPKEFLMTRMAIPLGIMVTELLLYWIFSMTVKLEIFWKSVLIDVGLYLVYGLALNYCYNKVEFRLVDETEVDRLEEEILNASRLQFEKQSKPATKKNSKKRKKHKEM